MPTSARTRTRTSELITPEVAATINAIMGREFTKVANKLVESPGDPDLRLNFRRVIHHFDDLEERICGAKKQPIYKKINKEIEQGQKAIDQFFGKNGAQRDIDASIESLSATSEESDIDMDGEVGITEQNPSAVQATVDPPKAFGNTTKDVISRILRSQLRGHGGIVKKRTKKIGPRNPSSISISGGPILIPHAAPCVNCRYKFRNEDPSCCRLEVDTDVKSTKATSCSACRERKKKCYWDDDEVQKDLLEMEIFSQPLELALKSMSEEEMDALMEQCQRLSVFLAETGMTVGKASRKKKMATL